MRSLIILCFSKDFDSLGARACGFSLHWLDDQIERLCAAHGASYLQLCHCKSIITNPFVGHGNWNCLQ